MRTRVDARLRAWPPAAAATAATVAALAATLMALGLLAGAARAGEWMQISCVNPDGSNAGYQGWTGSYDGNPTLESTNHAVCSPGSPMVAKLSAVVSGVSGDADEFLTYAPPPGSDLIGGSINVTLKAYGRGSSATSVAALHEPVFNPSDSDRFLVCAPLLPPCQNGTYTWTGTEPLPADRGGDLIAAATCAVSPQSGGTCNEDADDDDNWASVTIYGAHLLLQNNSIPNGAGFAGTALAPKVRGLAHVEFTAGDPQGPGVYLVQALIDGTAVYSATPNNNSGQCVPIGTDAGTGALMFDLQQPCPAAEAVDLPLLTTGLADGAHELMIRVIDAAGNAATVLDQTITTSNPQLTPKPRKGVRAQFVISWRWSGAHTSLRSISVRRLPRRATLAVSCRGRGCPRIRPRSAAGKRIPKLLKSLRNRSFRAGDKLNITVTAPHLKAERVQLTVRQNRIPRARLING